MKIIGIRASTRHLRYVVINQTGDTTTWINENDEHKWIAPAASVTKQQVLVNVFEEITRILKKYEPDLLILKISETMRGHPDPNRVAVESIILLSAQLNHIPSEEKKYKELKTNSKDVMNFVLEHIEKPSKLWDSELADAFATVLRKLKK